jgi:GT2 family glycosyltransferase
MNAGTSLAYTRRVTASSVLVDHRLIVVAWPCPPANPQSSARLIGRPQAVPLAATFVDCVDPEQLNGGGRLDSVLVAWADHGKAMWTDSALEILCGDDLIAFGSVTPAPFREFRAEVADGLADCSREARARVLDLLASAAIDAASAADASDLADHLHRLREALREPLPSGRVNPLQPRALVVDALSLIDDRTFYVQGWMDDAEMDIKRLVAISPEGVRVDLLPLAARYRRTDIDVALDTGDEGRQPVGFSCCFRLKVLSRHPRRWVFELHTNEGPGIQAHSARLLSRRDAVRARVLDDLDHERFPERGLISGHVYPALSRLQELNQEDAEITTLESYGVPSGSADISIIVPLYERIDFLEHQLAQFVNDPQMRAADLIYVLDSPELAEELHHDAAQLSRLYPIPFRVAYLRQKSGYAAATNLGASIARGRLLVLLNSDVLPDRPGWTGSMARCYDATPRIGALGPKLLFEDESLQHAGMYFWRAPDSPVWENRHYFKALHRHLPAANASRPVPAVTGACLMVSRDLYEQVGGLAGTYLQGDYEDSDFCLRLIAAGRENWYWPEVELYHLEGQSYSGLLRARTQRYNAWLHTRLWNEQIEAVMARGEFASD